MYRWLYYSFSMNEQWRIRLWQFYLLRYVHKQVHFHLILWLELTWLGRNRVRKNRFWLWVPLCIFFCYSSWGNRLHECIPPLFWKFRFRYLPIFYLKSTPRSIDLVIGGLVHVVYRSDPSGWFFLDLALR